VRSRTMMLSLTAVFYQAVEKHPSASLRSSFVIATYCKVRLIPLDFARLASGRF